jgi:hypothetical protein
MSKQYEIDSFEKLCNVVNNENVDRLAVDLAQWLLVYANTVESIRESYPELTKDKLNTQIAKGAFVWVDDGKNDLLGVQVTNEATGEVTKIDYTKDEQEEE